MLSLAAIYLKRLAHLSMNYEHKTHGLRTYVCSCVCWPLAFLMSLTFDVCVDFEMVER